MTVYGGGVYGGGLGVTGAGVGIVFPDTVSAQYEYEEIIEFLTLQLGPTDGDFIQRRAKRTRPLRSFVLKYNAISKADIQTLYEFFIARKGRWEAFALFSFDSLPHTAISIGTGDGATADWNAIGKEISLLTAKVDGISVGASIEVGTGTDGQDKIIFSATPADGVVLTADWTGRRYYTDCLFTEDTMSLVRFTDTLYRTGLVIKQMSS